MNDSTREGAAAREGAPRIFQLDLLQEGLVDVEQVDVARIRPNPWQPRSEPDHPAVAELAASIGAHGLLQAVLVRPLKGGWYELIAGERRWRAVSLLGWPTMPARVLHHVDDHTAAVLALVENVDREDLTAWEEAQAVARLRERLAEAGRPSAGGELARLFGWSAAKVSERLTIADGLPADVVADSGLPLHDVKKLPKSLLLNAARAPHIADRLRLLAGALKLPLGGRLPAASRTRGRGRPAGSFTFQARRSGRVSLQIRRPVAELEAREAQDLLARLEPLVEALRLKAGE